jgi:HK97 family phage portal protein
MFDRVKSLFSRKFASVRDLFGGIYAEVPLNRLQDYESYLRAGSGRCWALWKACDIIAQVVMETETQLIGAKDQPVENPDIARLLKYPNEYQTFSELVYLTVMHLKLTGNAFWLKDQLSGNRLKPGALWSLNPKRMRIIPGQTRKVEYYEFMLLGRIQRFQPDEVIHFKRPHPDNEFWGLGDVEAAQDLFQDFLNRSDWQARFWSNGASPSGLMVLDNDVSVTKEEWAEMKARWNSEYGGVKNSGKTAWINGKWKYQQLGLSHADMQDIEKLKLSVDQIFIVLGVPLSVAGIDKAANRATAEVDRIQFRQNTVKPMVQILSDTINTDLIADWGKDLTLRWNISGLVDTSAAIADYSQAFDRGIISINEFRMQIGLQPIEEPLYNQHFIVASLVPLDLAGVADQGQTQAAAASISQRFAELALAPRRNGSPGNVSVDTGNGGR